ncbi:MAG: hypothetical protein NVSMB32_00020 [Actinomycetota bacterium]
MDVQGTRYHLVHGRQDWGACLDPGTGRPLGDLWDAAIHTALEYDSASAALRLTRDTPLFRRASPLPQFDVDLRRGAGRDAYENWYWIDHDKASIRRRGAGEVASSVWWAGSALTASCEGDSGMAAGQFVSCAPPPPAGIVLQGLAVTTRHYLVVGYWSRPADAAVTPEQGLLVFDLHQAGDPLRLLWPGDTTFRPWDLADTSGGGVLVLDRHHATYWELDADFRCLGHIDPDLPAPFEPVDPVQPRVRISGRVTPVGFSLRGTSLPQAIDPISIEPGPEGTVVILDSAPGADYSQVLLYRGASPMARFSLKEAVEVIDPASPDGRPARYSVRGHDIAYLAGPPATGPLGPPMLYIADAMGKQAIAFTLDMGKERLVAQPDFLPLRRWEGKALVRAAEGAWYDFDDRWVPLEPFGLCEFVPEGRLTTSTSFNPAWPGQPFDSNIPGCTWHRLFIDAQVPGGTSVAVRARAADDATLLTQTPWTSQPVPYRRSDGAELPWYDPWPDLRLPDRSLPAGTGTWELLFQGIHGRYLEVELSLRGGGGSSPALRALRAWYPRFSYRDHYLPAAYTEEDTPAGFLDRFLANFEGFYTGIEEHIEHSHLLLDARTAPPEDLQWLACWFNLTLDPQWGERQQRFLVQWVDRFYRLRGTLAGLLATLRVFLDGQVDERIFSATCSDAYTNVGGVRLVERFLTRHLAGAPAGGSPGLVREAAHRFDVLVPADLAPDRLEMVRQIVALGKPAHTLYEVRPYWALFIIGQARLGIDTQLGPSPEFSATLEGATFLGSTYLGFAHPNDIADRMLVGRDRLGDLPRL